MINKHEAVWTMQRNTHDSSNQVTVNNFTMLPNDIECEMCSNWFVLECTAAAVRKKRNAPVIWFWPPVKWRKQVPQEYLLPSSWSSMQSIRSWHFLQFPFLFRFVSFWVCYEMWVPFLFCFIMIHVSHHTHIAFTLHMLIRRL